MIELKVFRWKRYLLILLLVSIVQAVAFIGLYSHVVRYGLAQDNETADVIIVLGAAVWPNGPSPALRARVWHGSKLYHDGRARYLIMTGGMGQFPPTEAEAMAVLAGSWGVGQQSIFIENRSVNTRENMAFAAEIMRENDWTSALIVTDYFHMRRATLIARDFGITPIRAPVTEKMSYYIPRERLRYTVRECAALIHYILVRPFRKNNLNKLTYPVNSGYNFFTNRNIIIYIHYSEGNL